MGNTGIPSPEKRAKYDYSLAFKFQVVYVVEKWQHAYKQSQKAGGRILKYPELFLAVSGALVIKIRG